MVGVSRSFRVRAAVLQAMDARGVSHKELAKRLDFSDAYLASRLGGRGPLTYSEVDAYARALGVRVDELDSAR